MKEDVVVKIEIIQSSIRRLEGQQDEFTQELLKKEYEELEKFKNKYPEFFI